MVPSLAKSRVTLGASRGPESCNVPNKYPWDHVLRSGQRRDAGKLLSVIGETKDDVDRLAQEYARRTQVVGQLTGGSASTYQWNDLRLGSRCCLR
jgi:hypothetical protein